MNDLQEATHTYASYSFAAYCEQVAKNKRDKYFSENFDETDREAAFGPHNGCDTCQGTGWVPVSKDDMSDPYRRLWVQAEITTPSQDGFHLIPCQSCNSGKPEEHIVKQGTSFVRKNIVTGESVGSFEPKSGLREQTENPNHRNAQKKLDHEKNVHTGDGPDNKKDDKQGGEHDSPAQRKTQSNERRKQKEKERSQKKLMPYEFASQKEAERAASHLGLQGSHTSGNGIYKPGSSEYSLRDAVHRKKEKQKMKGGRFHREEAEGLSTGIGIANPEQIFGVVKRIVKGE
jgi:hypothetical protein